MGRRSWRPTKGKLSAAIFGALLREEVAEAVAHRVWTFPVLKLLRPYFLHRRALLGTLCRAGWETVKELIGDASAADIRPDMVAAAHNAVTVQANDSDGLERVIVASARGRDDRGKIAVSHSCLRYRAND